MIKELQFRILPRETVNEDSLKAVVVRETGIPAQSIHAIRVLKKSVDARQRTVFVNVKLRVFVDETPTEAEYRSVEYKDVSAAKPVIIVGAGPGGLFAALRLIELGLRPIVLERGKNVRDRRKDISLITKEQRIDRGNSVIPNDGDVFSPSAIII